jgi:glycosyltransferase involved in cell wall biosynthesis
MKILIILVYFERPNIVLNALTSFNDITYKNYEIVIIDDGSRAPVEPIARRVLKPDVLEKTKFINTGHSIEYKKANGGSYHGKFINEAIEQSDAGLVFVVCDDDALIPSSIDGIIEWFRQRPNVVYTYGHVIEFDPETEKIGRHIPPRPTTLNHTGTINPSCQVDSSQVIFRSIIHNEDGISYKYPMTSALDADFFHDMQTLYGPGEFCGYYVQFKGKFANQMGEREDEFETGDM